MKRRSIKLSNVRLVRAKRGDLDRGLLAYLSFTVNGALRVDGATLRRTRAGRYVLSYPCRRSWAGSKHFVVRPIGGAARREIEAQVFEALGLGGGP